MRKSLLVLVALLATAPGLAACSGNGSDDGSSDGSGSAASSGTAGRTTVHIRIEDGQVTPHGDRVDAKVGKPVVLHIDADRAGEIDVHSTPEQHIDFPEGTSTRTLTIDRPGIVDVEDHALDKVIVQLQVS
jgi:hypothetical protein